MWPLVTVTIIGAMCSLALLRPDGDQAISKLERLGYPRFRGSTYLLMGWVGNLGNLASSFWHIVYMSTVIKKD